MPVRSDRGGSIPRILVVDDHDLVRRGVRHILEAQPAWEVVGEALNGQEAVRLNRQLSTDEIVKSNPNSKVLILTMYENSIIWQAAQASGARGLITKSRTADELVPAL